MPLETTSVKLAERILVLTHALLSAARRQDWDDFNETLRAREAALMEISGKALGNDATDILAKAHETDSVVERTVKDAQGEVVGQLAAAYRERRGLSGYARRGRTGGLLDHTG